MVPGVTATHGSPNQMKNSNSQGLISNNSYRAMFNKECYWFVKSNWTRVVFITEFVKRVCTIEFPLYKVEYSMPDESGGVDMAPAYNWWMCRYRWQPRGVILGCLFMYLMLSSNVLPTLFSGELWRKGTFQTIFIK